MKLRPIILCTKLLNKIFLTPTHLSQIVSLFQNFLSQSILYGSNVILNRFTPKKYIHRYFIFRLKPKKTLCIIFYENLGTFPVHSK